jgi:hypothetical protein
MFSENDERLQEGKYICVCKRRRTVRSSIRMGLDHKGVFLLIQKECPSVQCFVCTVHGMDGFLENIGSSAESIRMKTNVMGISSMSDNVMGISSISVVVQMEWNEPFFRDCFDNTGKIVTVISLKQNPFVRFKMISQLIQDKKITFGVAMMKSVEERGLCRVIQ